jgi:hypothetical protein
MTAAAVRVLPVPVAISNRKRSLPSRTAAWRLMDGFKLVGAQEAQFVGLDVCGAFGLVLPAGFGLVVRALGQDDVVVGDVLGDQALGIRVTFL